jgi:hypothetical protein
MIRADDRGVKGSAYQGPATVRGPSLEQPLIYVYSKGLARPQSPTNNEADSEPLQKSLTNPVYQHGINAPHQYEHTYSLSTVNSRRTSVMPNIFNGYFARNGSLYTRITRSYHKLHMYSVRSTYGLRCSRFKASQLWNNLPAKLTNINSNYIFKRELKYHMLQNMEC